MSRNAFVALCLCFAVPLGAQQPALSEKVEVRLIEVDAVVTDRKGNAVSGLKAEDFEILENGRPQAVTNFTEVQDGVDVTARATGAQVEGGTPATPQRQPRSIVILVDALPIRGRPRRTLFADLNALVEKTMGEGDRGQVLTWHDRGGLRPLTPMTRARAEILAALTKAEGTLQAEPQDLTAGAEAEWFREMAAVPEPGGTRFDGEGNVTESARQLASQNLALMRRKTAAFQRVVAGMAEPAHRNVLVYVSGAFPMNAGAPGVASLQARMDLSESADYDTGPMLEAIARTANSNGVIVYALRPDLSSAVSRIRTAPSPAFFEMDTDIDRSPVTPFLTDMSLEQTLMQNDAQALSLLTTATGGTLAVGTSAIKDAVDRIARDLGSYYTLAYRAAADGSDRERRIEVRSRNRKHVVRTRQTILDRSDETRTRDLLVARLFEAGGEGQIEFEIEAGAAQAGVIPIELTIPVEQLRFEPEGEELAADFSVLLVAGRDIGQITRLIDQTKRVTVPKDKKPAGVVRYQFQLQTGAARSTRVSVAVFDEKAGLAGIETIEVAGGEVRGDAVSSGSLANDAWRDALGRAASERRLVLVYFRPKSCRACTRFENETLTHPAIRRKLDEVVFARVSSTAGELAKSWKTREAGLGVFDRKGTFRLSFDGIPDLATLGIILDDISDVAPHFERAIAAAENGEPQDGELDTAIALMILGRRSEARAALERAIAGGKPETRQTAFVARALLDGQEGRAADALPLLDSVIAGARTPAIAGEAWLTIGLLRRMARARDGASDDAARAFAKARDLLGAGESRIAATSDEALAALETAADGSGPIRIIPPGEQVVSGRVPVATIVASAEIAAVAFTLDGAEVERVQRPPFAATVDFGRVPEERTLGVIAFDGLGNEAGRDELTVNEGGERFWFRIVEPGEGQVLGPATVKMKLRAPAGHAVQRVTISWNDEVRTIVTGPPWEADVSLPGELGVLRGVAQLGDGRSAEDAVLLNASGHTERADVQLVELPVTVSDPAATLETSGIVVREGGKRRAPESVQNPAESPLTIGFVFDTSASMQDALVNVQEAALGFVDSVLTARDRGFIVSFSTRARLVQAPTADKARLRAKVLSLRARGSTALYDAIAVGLLQLQGVKGRRALVVFTDGADLTSRYGAIDVAALAKRTHVPIHLIATTPNRSTVKVGGPRPDELRWGAMYRSLSAMAESTGGRAYVLDRLDDLPDVYRRIGEALRSQFLVFVRAEAGKHENDWRAIEVVGRGVRLFAPEGYYAPW
ncbi:MAG TPA: VWA domain-containing protein [Thermoanaerobaculia bacterium]|nr:VWA domain-containing protein [Thermoanaerobaculia bacterium]